MAENVFGILIKLESNKTQISVRTVIEKRNPLEKTSEQEIFLTNKEIRNAITKVNKEIKKNPKHEFLGEFEIVFDGKKTGRIQWYYPFGVRYNHFFKGKGIAKLIHNETAKKARKIFSGMKKLNINPSTSSKQIKRHIMAMGFVPGIPYSIERALKTKGPIRKGISKLRHVFYPKNRLK